MVPHCSAISVGRARMEAGYATPSIYEFGGRDRTKERSRSQSPIYETMDFGITKETIRTNTADTCA